jgi:transposase
LSRYPAGSASWCGLCPGNHESAGKRRSGRTRHGNPHLQAALVEAAWVVSRTATRLGTRFRRLHRRFGKTAGKKAAVAVAHTILVIAWHLLAGQTSYTDLGTDYYTLRDDPDARKNRLLRQLEGLGYAVALTRRHSPQR